MNFINTFLLKSLMNSYNPVNSPGYFDPIIKKATTIKDLSLYKNREKYD